MPRSKSICNIAFDPQMRPKSLYYKSLQILQNLEYPRTLFRVPPDAFSSTPGHFFFKFRTVTSAQDIITHLIRPIRSIRSGLPGGNQAFDIIPQCTVYPADL